uniref:Uncharacterized protein n=1 Tax=Oryza sativa subsp. japonica TaxID=39947 RepID=Q7EZ37_ORYSJ|nr:hypothetical protein [Oryza sativa Japonica Group]
MEPPYGGGGTARHASCQGSARHDGWDGDRDATVAARQPIAVRPCGGGATADGGSAARRCSTRRWQCRGAAEAGAVRHDGSGADVVGGGARLRMVRPGHRLSGSGRAADLNRKGIDCMKFRRDLHGDKLRDWRKVVNNWEGLNLVEYCKDKLWWTLSKDGSSL